MRGMQGSAHAATHDKHRLLGLGASKGWLAWAAQGKVGWFRFRKTASRRRATGNSKGIRGQAAGSTQQAAQIGNGDCRDQVISKSLRPRVQPNMHRARVSNKLADISDRMVGQGHPGRRFLKFTKWRSPGDGMARPSGSEIV